jgi:hypothetical protein
MAEVLVMVYLLFSDYDAINPIITYVQTSI